ncbi:carboxymuconolactone decarboxylase family protein [Rathayibacter sp. VKM Ac-2835]|uniref:carboxymuconolactone decarboxylase family protein n=1 Tax=Rathayibacter sp. VKM Ac-2835 TaxID=2739043 RepID=UPI0015630914|nr:carboxymuconolactone decarboxylase family protein [Rathayibacter sp. VKM Ac-2835]NRG41041.1 carboxymuconolactone decarboxylase family protein [Rathayibacter sp. VKM Ac-2835]
MPDAQYRGDEEQSPETRTHEAVTSSGSGGGTPRFPPRPVDDWTDEVDQAFAPLFGGRPSSPGSRPQANILGIYAWHPDFIRGWLPFSNHLRSSTLSDRVREIAIIRTVWLARGEYEWAQHVRSARAAGHLSDAELDALTVGPDDPRWVTGDAALVRAVDEMIVDRAVSDDTWAALADVLDRRQLIDFTFTVSTYDMHSLAFRVLDLRLDPGLDGFPSGEQTP